METFSALLVLCAGNSPATGEFPAQRPVARSFDVSLICALNKRLSKQSWGWWFKTPSCSLLRHRISQNTMRTTPAGFPVCIVLRCISKKCVYQCDMSTELVAKIIHCNISGQHIGTYHIFKWLDILWRRLNSVISKAWRHSCHGWSRTVCSRS